MEEVRDCKKELEDSLCPIVESLDPFFISVLHHREEAESAHSNDWQRGNYFGVFFFGWVLIEISVVGKD